MKNTLNINYSLNNNIGIPSDHTAALWNAYGVHVHKMVVQFLVNGNVDDKQHWYNSMMQELTNFATILGRLELSGISVITLANIGSMFRQYLETSNELPVPVEVPLLEFVLYPAIQAMLIEPIWWEGQQLTPFVPNMAVESVAIVKNIIGSIASYSDIIPEVENALATTRQAQTLTESAIKEKQLEIQRLKEQS
ncbi:hypothetical protein EW146_g5796 [Bondarzewia mesenterica]|uniref:Uncharacterized protein n=1 Tax=Bondarzewia mesenterica TaxID=1095465 RepID=A0A4S4LQG9_9AGAM|nr:hypothetical protein EW146_g5796 [Bondarzewia mesenterica]